MFTITAAENLFKFLTLILFEPSSNMVRLVRDERLSILGILLCIKNSSRRLVNVSKCSTTRM